MTTSQKQTESDFPRWIAPDEECVWCRHLSLHPLTLRMEKDCIITTYECDNKECEHFKRYNVEALFRIKLDGKFFVENYEAFLREKKT